MYEKMKVRLIGIVPMLTHNARLGDENSSYTTRLKQLIMEKKQAKNNITDKLLKSITQTEFEGGAYFDNEGKIMIPSDVMEGMLANAGAKNAGTTKSQIVISVMVPEHFYFTKVDGPLDIKNASKKAFMINVLLRFKKQKFYAQDRKSLIGLLKARYIMILN